MEKAELLVAMDIIRKEQGSYINDWVVKHYSDGYHPCSLAFSGDYLSHSTMEKLFEAGFSVCDVGSKWEVW